MGGRISSKERTSPKTCNDKSSSIRDLLHSEEPTFSNPHTEANALNIFAENFDMSDRKISQLLNSDDLASVLGQLLTLNSLCVKVNAKASACVNCGKLLRFSSIKFDCKHLICRECSLDLDRINSSCQKCYALSRLPQLFNHEESKLIVSEASLVCQRCFRNCSISLAVTLKCAHSFCKNCLELYLIGRIESNSKELNCPRFNCETAIDLHNMNALLDEELFMLYYNSRARLDEEESGLSVWEMLSRVCPNCNSKYEANASMTEILCITCMKTFCCLCDNFHSGNTCSEYADSLEKNILMSLPDTVCCPYCRYGVVRKSGCNLMSCSSSVCKGKNFFCFLCLSPLKYEDLNSHFEEQGISGASCLRKFSI